MKHDTVSSRPSTAPSAAAPGAGTLAAAKRWFSARPARGLRQQVEQLLSLGQLQDMAELLRVEPCSVAITGPVNAGKSTLLNALAGKPLAAVSALPGTTSQPCAYDALGFRLIDTPGTDEFAAETRRATALAAVDEARLAVLLLDASRGVTAVDRALFDEVTHRLPAPKPAEGGPPPDQASSSLIVALNKMDLVRRQERPRVVAQAAHNLELPQGEVVALSALKQWGLDELARRLVDAAPAMAEALAQAMPAYRDQLAQQLVQRYATAAAAVAISPLAIPTLAPLTVLQLSLVLRLARLYGHPLDWQRARELLPTLLGAFGWRELFRRALRVVPLTGWVLSSAVAYGGTFATGQAALHFFRSGQPPTTEQRQRWWEEGQAAEQSRSEETRARGKR